MNNSIKFLVDEKDHGKRLDVFLSKKIDCLTRSNIKKIINASNVKINNEIVTSPSKKVKFKDVVLVELSINNSEKLLPSKINLDIQYEDNDIIVINKPTGIAVQSGTRSFKNIIDVLKDTKYFENTKPLDPYLWIAK